MKDENESMLFVDRVAFVAEVYSFSGLPAARKTLKYDSDDIKALWSQSIYRFVLLCIVTMQEDIILISGGKGKLMT